MTIPLSPLLGGTTLERGMVWSSLELELKIKHQKSRKEVGRHANRSIVTTSGISNCGNPDSGCPKTIELYRCHLSYYIWHPRVGSMIDITNLFLLEIGQELRSEITKKGIAGDKTGFI